MLPTIARRFEEMLNLPKPQVRSPRPRLAAGPGSPVAGRRPAPGPPRVLRGVRRQGARHPEGTHHQGRVDQPARVDPHGSQEAGRQERDLDGRGRHAQHPAAPRHLARLDQDRHRDRGRRLPGQGRPHAGQRPRHHVPRRPHAVHGLVGHRRAQGRSRPERQAQAEGTVTMDARARVRGGQRRSCSRALAACAPSPARRRPTARRGRPTARRT